MNIDNIGKFIKKLRENKGLTQEQLAEMIPISRQAVSKWERGLAIPDSSVLIRLSEIFSITINEILSGQKITKENEKEINQITLSLFDDAKKKKKIIRILSLILIVFAFAFLVYYFVISYRSIKVYTVSGMGDNISLSNGIFVRTNEKLFFRIGDFDISDDNTNITNLTLYYIDKNGNEKIIVSSDDTSILFIDYVGYDDYLDTSNIDYIIKNMYLKIKTDEGKENFKLYFAKDYVNDNLLLKKYKNIGNVEDKKLKYNLDNENFKIIDSIKKTYNLEDNNYIYSKIENNITTNILFYTDSNIIKILIYESNVIFKSWIYDMNEENLDYHNYKDNKSYLFKNGSTNCKNCNENELENIINDFRKILNDSFSD